ncbi:MAG: alcohol dehydrogenase catalytic domain-containing protein [Nocardioidaceae bacterium]|nr:alcohol dehydrogenase catalytic domain-containing protein [Nocardioidaceae bacterium]
MRAAVFHDAGDVRLEHVPDPTPAAGEVVVRVLRSGMCGTDLGEWTKGPRTFPVRTPHPVTGHHGPMIPGHELVGEVVETVPGSGWETGRLVASGAGVSCGTCDRCREGRTNLCRRYYTLGLNTHGGMAELVSVPMSTLRPVPDGLGLDAAGLAQPMAVGLHAARRAGVRPGDTVVLIGAGAIGTFVLAGLRDLVDCDVVVVDFAGRRLERAARTGATTTVAAGDDGDAAVAEAVGPGGADVVIEASGALGMVGRAQAMVRPGGRILQVGLPSGPQEIDLHALVMREVTLETTLAHVCGDDLSPAMEILARTGLATELLDSVRPLSDLAGQLDRMASGGLDGKVLFDPTMEPEIDTRSSDT